MTDHEANVRVRKLLNEADRILKASQRVTERRLLWAYRRVLDSVKGKLAELYVSATDPNEVQMRKFARLISIESQLAGEIRDLTQVSVNITDQSVKDAFLKSYNGTGKAFEIGTGMDLAFDRIPKDAIRFAVSDTLWLDALKAHNAKLLTETQTAFETALRTNAREEVISGLAEGKPYRQVAKAIEERFGVAAGRARTIAFTEMHRAHSVGRLEGIKRGAEAAERLGIETVKLWRHNDIGEPRPTHLAADGQRVAADAMFDIGGVQMEAPGLSGDPAEDVLCHCSVSIELQGLDKISSEAT